MKDWLVMLFLGADNDLFQFGQNLLDEVTRVGSTDCVTIVAELDPTTPKADTLRGELLPGRRDMRNIGPTKGDPAEIIDFIEDSKAAYEARNRALILWDHGNGWQNVHVFEQVVDAVKLVKERHGLREATSEDGVSLFVESLRTVLDPERGIAIVGFDACLMSMIEVAFELRDTAQFMVASQHVVPASRGWAYEALFRALTMHPKMNAEELVRTMVDTFSGSYNGLNEPVTLTGLRLSSEVDRAVAAIDSFSRALLGVIAKGDREKSEAKGGLVERDVRSEIVYARRHTQSFGNPDYADLLSFCKEIQKRFPDEPRLMRTAGLVTSAMERLVVRHMRSSTASIGNANGVSVYFPQPARGVKIAESYRSLDFANPLYCRWNTFLEVIVEGAEVDQQQIVESQIMLGMGDAPVQKHCGCKGCGDSKESDGNGVVHHMPAPLPSAPPPAARQRKTRMR